METRAHYVAVGAFVLAVIFLGFVAVLWLGRAEFAQETKRYYIYFRGSVAGLNKGSQVQYNGIPVGRVIDIRVDPSNLEQIQVTVEIDTSIVNIKSDAQAFLEANILNGIATVQIRGGTREASELVPRPGHKYAVITAGRSELEEVKASLPELVADLKAAAHRLNDLLDENNRRAVSDTLQNLRSITEALVDASRQFQVMIQENRPGIRDFTHSTLNQVGDLVTDLQRFVASMTRFASELERNPPKLLFGDRREGYRPQ